MKFSHQGRQPRFRVNSCARAPPLLVWGGVVGVNSSVQAVREAVATCTHPSLLGAAVRRGGRALRGEAGTWRGKRVATWIPGCPARPGQAARRRGRRQDRTTPSTSLAIDQKRGLSGGVASWPFGNIAKRWPLRSPSGLDELVRAVRYRNTDSDCTTAPHRPWVTPANQPKLS